MKTYHSRVLAAICSILLLVIISQGQSLTLYSEKVLYTRDQVDPERRLSLDFADAACWTGLFLDVHSSLGGREKVGLYADSRGRVNVPLAFAIPSISWGLAKWMEYK